MNANVRERGAREAAWRLVKALFWNGSTAATNDQLGNGLCVCQCVLVVLHFFRSSDPPPLLGGSKLGAVFRSTEAARINPCSVIVMIETSLVPLSVAVVWFTGGARLCDESHTTAHWPIMIKPK